MDAELRDKLLTRVGVLHKSTPCEAITARLVVDTILPTIQQEIAKARIDENNRYKEAFTEGLIHAEIHSNVSELLQKIIPACDIRITELSQTLKEHKEK